MVMKKNKSTFTKEKPWFTINLIIEFLLIFFSIMIPHIFILINHEINSCSHHIKGKRTEDGLLWIWGRTFGFTALIWFIISIYQGFTMNKHAKLFHSKTKARDLHCISSFLSILFMGIHLFILYISEPWRSIFLLRKREHLPMNLFLIKIWTGIIFGVIMVFVSLLSVFARKPTIMNKIGYKRFKLIHWILLASTLILIFHIIFINTELWIMGLRLKFLEG
ncbi:MAG: hypothetical protein ACFFAN_18875 [Promethearchaeota archaeon]